MTSAGFRQIGMRREPAADRLPGVWPGGGEDGADVGQLAGRGPGRGVAQAGGFPPGRAGQHRTGPVAQVPVWASPLLRQRATLSRAGSAVTLGRAGSAVTLEVPRPGRRCLWGAYSVDIPENAPRRRGCGRRAAGYGAENDSAVTAAPGAPGRGPGHRARGGGGARCGGGGARCGGGGARCGGRGARCRWAAVRAGSPRRLPGQRRPGGLPGSAALAGCRVTPPWRAAGQRRPDWARPR